MKRLDDNCTVLHGNSYMLSFNDYCVDLATCERSFSTLKLVKSYSRSTMGEQRLADLASISIEKEISNTIIIDDVNNEFVATDKSRRIQLM